MNRIETFMSKLADLMEEYRVDVDVNMSPGGYGGDVFDCIEFSSEPDWETDEPRYEEFEMGGSWDHTALRETLIENKKEN